MGEDRSRPEPGEETHVDAGPPRGPDRSVGHASTRRPPPSLLELAWAMFTLGLVSFGGNNALLMTRMVVERRRWLTQEAIDAGIALATMSPGGNSSNLSFEVGRRLRGLPGGIVAYVSMSLPGIVLVVAVGGAVMAVDGGLVLGMLRGAQAGVVAMVVMVGVKLAQGALRGAVAWLLACVSFVLVAFTHAPIFVVVPPLALLGYWVQRRTSRRGPDVVA